MLHDWGCRTVITSFLERIQTRYPQLTKGQRKVVDRLIQQPQLLAFATSSEIGREAGVSESTVIRLAYALGYRSFVEMQNEARKALTAQRTRDILSRSATTVQAEQSVLDRVMGTDARLIEQTLAQLSRDAFQRAVDLLARAEHIYVAGARSSYGVAAFLAYTLRTQLGAATLLEPDHPHFFQDLSGMGPRTALVAISFPRYAESTLRLVGYAQRTECPVVGITDSPVSPVGYRATVTLTAPVDSPAATNSYTAPLSLLTALLTGVALKRKDEVDRQLTRIEQVYAEWDGKQGGLSRRDRSS